MSLNVRKAICPDLLTTEVPKEAAHEIAPILQVIYQASIDRSEVPKDWHSANIVVVYEKGDKSCTANYRPVSLTSVLCKMLEQIIYLHVMIHWEDYKILVDFQYSFRNKRLCETQLIVTSFH